MMKLLSFAVLGCTVVGSGLTAQKSKPSERNGPLGSVNMLEKFMASQPKGCKCPSRQTSEKNDLAMLMFTYCDPVASPPADRFYNILNAPRTQCGPYTFVDYGKESAYTVCNMIGLAPVQDKHFPSELRECAKKCRYKHDRLCLTESSVQSDWDKYQTYPSYTESSVGSESSDTGKTNCPSSCEWRHKKECAVLCKPYTCLECKSPTLLTFEDGEDQTCSIFVDKGVHGKNTVYRGFNIKNGGVYNPWLHRCEFANECVYQTDIEAVVSKPQGLFNSQPLEPTSISRKKPFGLISVFVTLSSQDLSRKANLKVTAFLDKKELCNEFISLHAGCPVIFRPRNVKAFSKVNKIMFKFDLPDEDLDDVYLDIDNLLVCM